MDDGSSDATVQDGPALAHTLQQRLDLFLLPVLSVLDAQIDRRLVRTLAGTVRALLCWRNRAHGLLLSELGGYLLSPAHAPAGTKRLSNLLRSAKWAAATVERLLWHQADGHLCTLEADGTDVYVAWDESVLEKPESRSAEGLCPVRSSKAGRLSARKPGYNRPPGPPVFVPGHHWLSLLLLGRQGPPHLVTMRWWTTRGARATDKRSEEQVLLEEVARRWGGRVLHLWDRGFAGHPWLSQALALPLRFVVRWPTRYHLLDHEGERPAWQCVRGKRSWDHRELWDGRHHCWRKTGVLATMVWLPKHPAPLWLVVARRGQGQSPWYLLSNEPVQSIEDAWAVVFAYARRWQIELVWRYGKSELALESPRLWSWERRHKLLLIVTLAYAFLLSLLSTTDSLLRRQLLRHWCHRTGKRSQETLTPLYRLRSALSRLWLSHPQLSFLENPG
ncbi:MAG TPA: transposase [Chloroflexota bacterium]|jgi:hypothetical protein|nr:transposase [Chloroflexota bacterium]